MHALLRFALPLSLVLTLGACALPQGASDADATSESIDRLHVSDPTAEQRVREQIDLVSRRTRALCVAPENKAYFRHTPCLPIGVTEAHLKDQAKPTKAELDIARRVFAQLDEMNLQTQAVMRETNEPHYEALADKIERFYTPRIQHLQNEFLTGRLSWAAYNAERKKMNDDFVAEDTQAPLNAPSP